MPYADSKTFKSRIARLLADGMPAYLPSSTLRRAAIIFAGAIVTIGLLSGSPQTPMRMVFTRSAEGSPAQGHL